MFELFGLYRIYSKDFCSDSTFTFPSNKKIEGGN